MAENFDYRKIDEEVTEGRVDETKIDTLGKQAKARRDSTTFLKAPSFSRMTSFKSIGAISKDMSFIRNLFGSSKRIQPDDDDSFSDNTLNSGELTLITKDGQERKQGEEGDHVEETNKDFFDPPMPSLGTAGDFEQMEKRNAKAELGLNTLLSLVKREAQESVQISKNIPVSKEIDRVVVTDEVAEYLDRVTTKKQIDANMKKNNQEIQKALNFRKSAIVLMNSNYSKVLVRKIEPIYINEARSIISYRK